jgi:murein DD-endopeptidase MepM/ murein hydrolase activator NlpD
MNTLTHEQAIQFLHEVSHQISADQQADLAAHLAECDQCRAYADQLSVLQPMLTHALHTRRYAHPTNSSEAVAAILQHKRRSFMRKQIIVAVGLIMVATFALIATSLMRTSGQSWAGAPLTSTTVPTVIATAAPTLTPTTASPLPTPTTISAFTSIVATPTASRNTSSLTSFKLPWTAGITHCVTQNHRVQGNGWGVDFDLKQELLLAPQDGQVTYAGWNSAGGGNTITVLHTGGLTSTYMHLSEIYVAIGEQLTQGQPIGTSGDIGDTPGPLLHFQLEDNGHMVEPIFTEVGHALKEGDCVTSQNTGDRFEPNDDFDQATPIDLNVKYDQLNFAMLTPTAGSWDNDYFKVRVKPSMVVTCRTSDLSAGTDTNLILYDDSRNGLEGNDNAAPATGDKSSSVTYKVTYEGWLYVLIGEGVSRTPAEAQRAIYSLECVTLATATAVPSTAGSSTTTPVPLPAGADRFEPNDDFDQATPIDLNVKYDQLKFTMLNADSWDNDFFKVRVQPGISITCHTLDLSPGTDTNLILSDGDRNGIAGNDDVDRAKSDLSSSVTYLATSEGWLYVLVGEGFSRSPAEAQQATYSLECTTSK